MLVLLTGAFGNVGLSALDELLAQGRQVRCFDLPTKANRRAAARYRGRIETVWGDLRSRADVEAAVSGVDVALHVAFIIPKMSVTGIESESRPDWAEAVNIGGTRNLIDAMLAQPIPPKLIFTSSLHVYGRTADLPPPRRADEPVHPIEHYAQHKVACEEMIRSSGLQWSILRLAATLPVALKINPGMFDVPLENRMEFAHTRDVGLALANAVGKDDIWGKTLLIGGGPKCQHYYREMVKRIMAATGLDPMPEAAFTTTPFATDWLDTAESEQLLHYQHRTLDDYAVDMRRALGWKRPFIRLFRRPIMRSLLAHSAHWTRQQTRQPLAGRCALITGASSGIGAEVARQLARHGATVTLVARRMERLERLADEVRRDGGRAVVIVADLTDENERGDVLREAGAAMGGVDILVNSAGFGWYGYGSEMPWPLAEQMIQTNVIALTQLTLEAVREMKANGRGHIVNIGSIVGSLPEQGVAIYSATKSFVDSFTTALHRELRGTDVQVSLLRPGPVRTEFFERAATLERGARVPAEMFAITADDVARKVIGVLRRPRRVTHIPRWLAVAQWVEPCFGWLIDRMGPWLLRRSAAQLRH